MEDDDASFAVCLANYVGIYSRIRVSMGQPMTPMEVIGALTAVVALVVEQFPPEQQAHLWRLSHEQFDQLEEALGKETQERRMN